jgi:protein-tyrosine phosphatase
MGDTSFNFGKLVDVHTHILPCADDGSRSVGESLEMLRIYRENGVGTVVLTPHFYPQLEALETFIERRRESYDALLSAIAGSGEAFPRLVLGAEIEYFDDIAGVAQYPELRLGGSRALLVEMHDEPWGMRRVEALLELVASGITLILAHVERYLFEQKRSVVNALLQNGIVMQSNASFFLDKRTSSRALKLFDSGVIHLIGSDCHGTVNRPPCLHEASCLIVEKLGAEALERTMLRAHSIFDQT